MLFWKQNNHFPTDHYFRKIKSTLVVIENKLGRKENFLLITL